ncbi:hypothetical protein D1007_51452 [Hordeum vulgare]|nr:hypothetical protein D1007_51452 [Hordeum vulgare]
MRSLLVTRVPSRVGGGMACDVRWRVLYAVDLISTNLIRLVDGVLWLRMEALRIVLLDVDGRTVDARFLLEGERIDIGETVSFPCHFARVRNRISVTGVGRDGGDGPDGTRVPVGGDAVGERGDHGPGPPRRPPSPTGGPGLGGGPVEGGVDVRHVDLEGSDRHGESVARVSRSPGIKQGTPPPSFTFDLADSLAHLWSAPSSARSRVSQSFVWWKGKIKGDPLSYAQVTAAPPPLVHPISTKKSNMRGDGFGAGRHGCGAGRFNRGSGRGFDSNVWKRKAEIGASSSTRASGSEASGFAKWDAAAGGEHGDREHQESWKEGGEGRSSPCHDDKVDADKQATPPC